MMNNPGVLPTYQPETVLPSWIILPINFFFLSVMIYLYPSISPLLIVAVFVVVPLLIIVPELSLVAFMFIGLTKPWIDENIAFFQSFDYTFFLAFLVLVSLFIRLVKYRNSALPMFHQFIWPLAVLAILLFIGVIHTPSPDYGSVKAGRFLILNIPLFIVTILFFQRLADFVRIFRIIVLFSLVFAVVMIYEGMLNFLSGDFVGFVLRLTVLGANPISTGRIFSIAIVILFVYAYYEKRVSFRYILFGLSGFVFVCLLITNTRGPIVSTIAALFVFLLFFSGMKFKQLILFISVLILFFVLTVFLLPDFLTSRIMMYFSQDVAQQTLMVDRIDTAATRTAMWKLALSGSFDSFKQFLIGRGTGGYAALFPYYDFRWYPHNIFLEILYEIGAIGLMVFLVHLSKISEVSRRLIIHAKETDRYPLVIVVVMLAISAFLGTLISGDIADNRPLWFFFGLIVALYRHQHAMISGRQGELNNPVITS
jgi:O-antigen ligase